MEPTEPVDVNIVEEQEIEAAIETVTELFSFLDSE